ncbi:MAG: biotin--[acetyl-CoA-carboxylase] ligase [Planctomycetota bacterium]|jgi:BirA family biotin operon repressor/biotin-[acetyl-CoA-carboxylase] ligase
MSIQADFPSRWFDLEELLASTFCRSVRFQRECRSTNDLALTEQQAAADHALPRLLTTDAQTAGRGRGSNQWWAGEGSLAFSLRITPADFSVGRSQWPLVSLATALAVGDVLAEFGSAAPVGLKWPNDVQLGGRKVSGILVEPPPGNEDELVIGVGINVLNSLADAPEELRSIATSLVDETQEEVTCSPGDVLQRVLQCLEVELQRLASEQLTLRERWQSRCVLTGHRVSLEAGGQRIEGHCHGVDESGAILLDIDGDVRPWFGGIVRRVES